MTPLFYIFSGVYPFFPYFFENCKNIQTLDLSSFET
ncbi:MAG: hypothetical protein J5697_01265, partial [Clostridia bacterium]|nr:hypothetical protein [Clostridia bacterium]